MYMKIKLFFVFLFLAIGINSCKTQEEVTRNEKSNSKTASPFDFLLRPIISQEKIETTNYSILSIEQNETFLDVTVSPEISCDAYNYKVLSLPTSEQSTRIIFNLLIVQDCFGTSKSIIKNNVLRIDLANILPKSSSDGTVLITFPNSSQVFKYQLPK